MSAKSIRFHDLARYKMFAGVDMLADAVKVTLTTEAIAAEPVAGGPPDPKKHFRAD
ncbi:MAG TPA: hypothetical protein VLV56_13950 [Burkholderiales bacterium]|nr:hypothetical protein [Burkholderiales bacterium]